MKNTKNATKLAVLAVALLTIIATSAIGPSLAIIKVNFPQVSPTLIKSIVTIPALICIPISLLSNQFSRHIRKKYLLILGLIIYLIGAIVCYFSNNIYMLLGARGIFGIGLGIIAPMSLVLVGDFFEGKDRAKFMGYSSACSNIGGVIATPIVGIIAVIDWHNIFLIYLIALPILLVVIFCLLKVAPFDGYAPENRKENIHNETKHIKLNLEVFKYAVIIILAFITFYSIPTNIALLIKNRNLGNSETSAILITLVTLFAFFSAMSFGRVLRIFKETLILISFIIIAIGLIVLISANTFTFMGLGVILVGVGFGLIVPYSLYYASKCVHNKHTSLAITIVTTSIYVGEAICPIVLDYIAKFLNLGNVIGSFYAAEVLAIVAIIFSIVIIMLSKIKKSGTNQKSINLEDDGETNEIVVEVISVNDLSNDIKTGIDYNRIKSQIDNQVSFGYKKNKVNILENNK